MNEYFAAICVIFISANVGFIFSLIKKRNDVADVFWGIGFILLAWTAFFFSHNFNNHNILVNLLVTVWGVRLALHIGLRNRGKGEDFRYKAWRESWGKTFFIRSYFQVFILQGVLLFVISLPIIFVNKANGEFSIFSIVGLVVWTIGFAFEAVSDFQLLQFTKNPTNRGKIIQSGLWKYTRHPNYFGEVTLWWGIFCFTMPLGFWTIISPITISLLILYVSGIPMLEKKYENNTEFAEYKKRTSSFFPMLPK
jgi:steroid 5-alpha reductase family enzyme